MIRCPRRGGIFYDSLRFSPVGYATRTLAISELPTDVILLYPRVFVLQTARVNAAQFNRRRRYGHLPTGHKIMVQFFGNQRGEQIGKLFQLRREAFLKTARLNEFHSLFPAFTQLLERIIYPFILVSKLYREEHGRCVGRVRGCNDGNARAKQQGSPEPVVRFHGKGIGYKFPLLVYPIAPALRRKKPIDQNSSPVRKPGSNTPVQLMRKRTYLSAP